jgi:hypothetical protein
MTSSGSADPLRLDRDVPTTPEDVEVLRRLRYGPRLAFDEYLQALAALTPPAVETLRARRGPRGLPFDLLA